MSFSKIDLRRFARIAIVLLLGSLCAHGQVLRGSVTNGTTKKPGAGDDVILIKIDKVMNEEARTKTNARGEFSFNLPENQSMRAVRVVHEKVSYYQPVVPGTGSVAVTVYDVNETVAGIHRTDQSIVLQAQGAALQAYELFDVKNDSQPPLTQPNFSFYLPDGASVQSGQAMREGGMPLKSAPVPQTEKGKYLFMYPLTPGLTHFEVVYNLPYSGTLKFQPRLGGPVDRFYVVTPKSIGFTADPSQFQTAPEWPIDTSVKGIDVHVASGTNESAQLAFNISGDGLLPQDNSAQQSSEAGGPQENQGPGGGLGIPNERPNPLSQGQWAFLGVLVVFLAGGAVMVWMTSQRPGPVAVVASQPSQSTSLLDALKEEMFALETERINGKIDQQEYQNAKTALDKTLQRAMGRK